MQSYNKSTEIHDASASFARYNTLLQLEMHDEIFHFKIFKNFMKILKYFKTPFLKYFMKLLTLNIK